ncbi:LVIVD repeat-containing protein [Halobaculum limi]|uniref:LVIVD repeat-containing protein n=1 Tax=Halobaculum limi TaxID=3031916 RepID=UPI002406EB46|nr:hypothetical protein [Halobaculum sp. YSMS11]
MRRRDVLRVAGATLGVGVSARTLTRRTRADEHDEYAPLGSVQVEGAREAVVSADGRVAYLALGNGYATVDVSDPTDPTVLAARRDLRSDHPDGPISLLNDVKVAGDRLVCVAPAHGGRDLPHGVLTVDVSDPTDPVDVAFYETDFPIHNCEFDGRYCYLTGNGQVGNPLVVLDIDEQREVSRWSLFSLNDAWAEVSSGLRPIHDVTVRDGVAALAYWDAGTVLLDVSDPADPTPLGHVDPGDPATLRDPDPRASVVPPGNHHYSQLGPSGDLLAVGRETWAVSVDGDLTGGPSGVDLYDVSDPASPAHLSRIDPPPTPDPSFGGTWTTAHNLDLREDTLYTSWYQGGVKRHDVSDPANPTEETWWAVPDATRFWTAVLAVPGEFFVASSMGTRTGEQAGLWTFPDGPGTGGDRATLTERDSADTPPPTTGPTLTGTETPTPTSTPTETESAAAAPGFGLAVGAAGVATGAALAARRRRTDDDGDSDGDAE